MHILFDLSRSLRRASRSTKTGIDRVDLAYARFLPQFCESVDYIAGKRVPRMVPRGRIPDIVAAAPAESYGAVYDGVCAVLSQDVWPAQHRCLRLGLPSPSAYSTRFETFCESVRQTWYRRLPDNLAGAVYLNTSHTGLEQAARIRLLRSRGAKIVVLVHDLIPLDFPEFCRHGENRRHLERMACVCENADLVLVNSAYSRDRFLSWARQLGGRVPATAIIPLAVDSELLAPANLRALPSAPRPYFVCLGTIEARKNHAFLLLVWQRLAERAGEACPRLVVVGRRGWKVELAIDLLQTSNKLAPHVIEVSDMADAAVVALIRGARAVLQPSFVEGFSLPLIEARALGTPVIASDIFAHRELAAAGLRLIDPLDAPAWEDAILAASTRRTNVPPSPTVLTWQGHVESAVEAMAGTFGLEMRKPAVSEGHESARPAKSE